MTVTAIEANSDYLLVLPGPASFRLHGDYRRPEIDLQFSYRLGQRSFAAYRRDGPGNIAADEPARHLDRTMPTPYLASYCGDSEALASYRLGPLHSSARVSPLLAIPDDRTDRQLR